MTGNKFTQGADNVAMDVHVGTASVSGDDIAGDRALNVMNQVEYRETVNLIRLEKTRTATSPSRYARSPIHLR